MATSTCTTCTRAGQIPAATTALARPDNPDYGCHLPVFINMLPFEVMNKLKVTHMIQPSQIYTLEYLAFIY